MFSADGGLIVPDRFKRDSVAFVTYHAGYKAGLNGDSSMFGTKSAIAREAWASGYAEGKADRNDPDPAPAATKAAARFTAPQRQAQQQPARPAAQRPPTAVSRQWDAALGGLRRSTATLLAGSARQEAYQQGAAAARKGGMRLYGAHDRAEVKAWYAGFDSVAKARSGRR